MATFTPASFKRPGKVNWWSQSSSRRPGMRWVPCTTTGISCANRVSTHSMASSPPTMTTLMSWRAPKATAVSICGAESARMNAGASFSSTGNKALNRASGPTVGSASRAADQRRASRTRASSSSKRSALLAKPTRGQSKNKPDRGWIAMSSQVQPSKRTVAPQPATKPPLGATTPVKTPLDRVTGIKSLSGLMAKSALASGVILPISL